MVITLAVLVLATEVLIVIFPVIDYEILVVIAGIVIAVVMLTEHVPVVRIGIVVVAGVVIVMVDLDVMVATVMVIDFDVMASILMASILMASILVTGILVTGAVSAIMMVVGLNVVIVPFKNVDMTVILAATEVGAMGIPDVSDVEAVVITVNIVIQIMPALSRRHEDSWLERVDVELWVSVFVVVIYRFLRVILGHAFSPFLLD